MLPRTLEMACFQTGPGSTLGSAFVVVCCRVLQSWIITIFKTKTKKIYFYRRFASNSETIHYVYTQKCTLIHHFDHAWPL